MIVYDPGKWYGIHKLLQLHGSVVPDVMLNCGVSVVMVLIAHFSELTIFKNAYAHQIFTFGLSFLVIMRTNLSYSRYWEGISELIAMWSKWTDAVTNIIAFDELATGPAATCGEKFRAHVIHIMSLMSATIVVKFQEGNLDVLKDNVEKFEAPPVEEEVKAPARQATPRSPRNGIGAGTEKVYPKNPEVQEIGIGDNVTVLRALHDDHKDLKGARGQVVRRVDADGTMLVHLENGEEFWFTSKALALTSKLLGPTKAPQHSHQGDLTERGDDADGEMELLVVVHGMSPVEFSELLKAEDEGCPVHFLMLKLVRLVSLRHKAGGLAAPPPIVGRVFTELSGGFMAFQGARKVSTIPFPFPYAQIVQYLQLAFVLSCPFVVVAFVDELGFQMFFTFLGVFTFCSLNAVASQLEDPFGHDANDLPLRQLHHHFVCVLAQLDRSKLSDADLDSIEPLPEENKKTSVVKEVMENISAKAPEQLMAHVNQKVVASNGTMLHEDAVRQIFDSIDKNKNGVLDHDEITALCTRVGMLMPGEDRAIMLKAVDPHSVGEVAFEDLWAWYMDRHRKRELFSATQLGVLRGPNANDAQVIRSPRNTQVLSAIPATAPPMLRAS